MKHNLISSLTLVFSFLLLIQGGLIYGQVNPGGGVITPNPLTLFPDPSTYPCTGFNVEHMTSDPPPYPAPPTPCNHCIDCSVVPCKIIGSHDNVPIDPSNGELLQEHKGTYVNLDVNVERNLLDEGYPLSLSPSEHIAIDIEIDYETLGGIGNWINGTIPSGAEWVGMENANIGGTCFADWKTFMGVTNDVEIAKIDYINNNKTVRVYIKQFPKAELYENNDYPSGYGVVYSGKFSVWVPWPDPVYLENEVGFRLRTSLASYPNSLSMLNFDLPIEYKQEFPIFYSVSHSHPDPDPMARKADTHNQIEAFKLMPNPGTDVMVLEMDESLLIQKEEEADFNFLTVEMLNSIGQVAKEWVFTREQTKMKLDISDLPSGVYLAKIQTIKGSQTIRIRKM